MNQALHDKIHEFETFARDPYARRIIDAHIIHKDEGFFDPECNRCEEGRCPVCRGNIFYTEEGTERECDYCKGKGRV